MKQLQLADIARIGCLFVLFAAVSLSFEQEGGNLAEQRHVTLDSTGGITTELPKGPPKQHGRLPAIAYDSNGGAPTHKSLWPLSSRDYAGTVCLVVALLVAAGGGIGGGGVLVPLLMLVFGFSARLAVALSNITIVGGAISNFVFNCNKRHPFRDKACIDWDLLLVMEPSTILGALLGGYLNKAAPSWFTVSLLAILVTMISYLLVQRGLRTYQSESRLKLLEQASVLRDDSDATAPLLPDIENAAAASLSPAGSAPLPIPHSIAAESEQQTSNVTSMARSLHETLTEHLDNVVVWGSPLTLLTEHTSRRGESPRYHPRSAPSLPHTPRASRFAGVTDHGAFAGPSDVSLPGPAFPDDGEVENSQHLEHDESDGTGNSAAQIHVATPTGTAPILPPFSEHPASNGNRPSARETSTSPAAPAAPAYRIEPPQHEGTAGEQGIVTSADALGRTSNPGWDEASSPHGLVAPLIDNEESGEKAPEELESDCYEQLDRLLAAERQQFPLRKLAILLVMFFSVLITDSLKRQARCNSWLYWLIAVSIVPIMLVLMLGVRNQLVAAHHIKSKLACEEEIEWNERSTIIFPAICSFAGLVAGMFGVGGGIVKGPLLLEMGVIPEVAAASSATMILMTSAAASMVYLGFGGVPADYGILFFVCGLVATMLGQLATHAILRALNRRSVIIFSMAAMMLMATFAAYWQAVVTTAAAVHAHKFWSTAPFCSATAR